jgi:hypothetical protein
MKAILLLFAGAISVSAATVDSAWTDRERTIENQQISLWQGNLAKSQALKGDERLALLGFGLRCIAHRKTLQDHNAGVDSLYQEVQDAILTTPGHAEYFGKEVKRMMDDELAGRPVTGERYYHFQALGHLPSLETLKVLGELLDDERSKSIGPTVDGAPQASNAALAVESLEELGLRHRPMRPTQNTLASEQIPAWKQWFDQAKAGARKISFEGDPREYSLADTVRLPAFVREVRRPGLLPPKQSGESPGAEVGGISLFWIFTGLLALAVGGMAIWLQLRNRSSVQ